MHTQPVDPPQATQPAESPVRPRQRSLRSRPSARGYASCGVARPPQATQPAESPIRPRLRNLRSRPTTPGYASCGVSDPPQATQPAKDNKHFFSGFFPPFLSSRFVRLIFIAQSVAHVCGIPFPFYDNLRIIFGPIFTLKSTGKCGACIFECPLAPILLPFFK